MTSRRARYSEPLSILAWLTIAGIVVYVVLDVIAQALPPHYSPIRQPESDLAVGPYGWIMAVNFVVRGLLSAALLIALARVLAPSRRAFVGLLLLGVWTAGAFLLAVFPTDVSSRVQTVHGKAHLAIAFLAFLCIPIAESLLSRSLLDDPRWTGLGKRAGLFTRLTVAGFFVLLAGTVLHRIGGLTERIFLASVLLWMLVVALGLRPAWKRSSTVASP